MIKIDKIDKIDVDILNKLKRWYALQQEEEIKNIKDTFAKILRTKCKLEFDSLNISVNLYQKYSSVHINPVLQIEEEDLDDSILIVKYGLDIFLDDDKKKRIKMSINSSGEIIDIISINDVDLKLIKEQDELSNLPIKIDDLLIDWIGDKLYLIDSCSNRRELTIVSIYQNYEPHTALMSLDFNDNYIRFKNYDTCDYFAFLVNRYELGMNVCVAYLDIKRNIVYLGNSNNYYYPYAGCAIRKNSERDAEIFLSNREIYFDFYYKNQNCEQIHDHESNSFGSDTSGWYSLELSNQFAKLSECIKFININKIKIGDKNLNTSLISYIESEIIKASDLLINRVDDKYIVNILKIYNKIHDIVKICIPHKLDNIYYNMSRIYSLLLDKEKSIEFFKKSVQCGFYVCRHFEMDNDLNLIKNEHEILKFLSENKKIVKCLSNKCFCNKID